MEDEIAFEFDVFVSHASEDKEGFARPLAEALATAGLRVWFDEWTLVVGDRLRRKIDEGLKSSRFGVVILSPEFFSKNWPKLELDGLTALEGDGNDRILPVWHGVSRQDVAAFSPTLADRLASDSRKGVDGVCAEISLAIARTPAAAPTPAPQRRALRGALVDSFLSSRALSDIRLDTFGNNDDLAKIAPKARATEEQCTAKVAFCLVPLGDAEELFGDELYGWAAQKNWTAMHPLAHTDLRPRGDGIIALQQRHSDEPPSRYTYISGAGYVEWGRALGGSNGDVCTVRLGPLLWAASDLYEFASELKAKFGLRSSYELVVSVVDARDTCLSHLGKSWLEPWDRHFEYYRPKARDVNVQFRWSISMPAGEQDKMELLSKLDTYLNRVWGDPNPRGHDHPREHSGETVLSAAYRDRDPWE